jgi:hypothetical protein
MVRRVAYQAVGFVLPVGVELLLHGQAVTCSTCSSAQRLFGRVRRPHAVAAMFQVEPAHAPTRGGGTGGAGCAEPRGRLRQTFSSRTGLAEVVVNRLGCTA